MPELHPHVADVQLNELREYEVIDKRNFKIKYKDTHPFKDVHNMWCFPAQDIVDIKEYIKRKNKE
jgi:hypothetical protein